MRKSAPKSARVSFDCPVAGGGWWGASGPTRVASAIWGSGHCGAALKSQPNPPRFLPQSCQIPANSCPIGCDWVQFSSRPFRPTLFHKVFICLVPALPQRYSQYICIKALDRVRIPLSPPVYSYSEPNGGRIKMRKSLWAATEQKCDFNARGISSGFGPRPSRKTVREWSPFCCR